MKTFKEFYNAPNSVEDMDFSNIVDEILEERGMGIGTDGEKQGDGGADVCVCPKCGHRQEHKKGTPCKEISCPKCGTKMSGEEKKIEEKVRNELDRKKNRAKKDALNVATKGDFKNWDIKKQANFHAKFEYKPISPTKGRYVRRQKPLNVADVLKQLRKKSIKMKRLLKSKGKQIAARSARIRKSHNR